MNYSITFIGGPLDLQRITAPGIAPRYYRAPVTLPDALRFGAHSDKPTLPRVATVEIAEYEVVPFSPGPGRCTSYVGFLMEVR